MIAPVLIAACALAINYASYSRNQTRLQGAADTASMATAKEFTLSNGKEDLLKSLAASYVTSSARAITVDTTIDVASDAKMVRSSSH